MLQFLRRLFGGHRPSAACLARAGHLGVDELARRLGVPEGELRRLHVSYHGFRVPKRTGGVRTLVAPAPALKSMQRRVLRRVLQAAAISRLDGEGRRVDLHGLRHTAASQLARGGVGLVLAQKLLGHADPKLTARVYSHVEVEDLRAAVVALPCAQPASQAKEVG